MNANGNKLTMGNALGNLFSLSLYRIAKSSCLFSLPLLQKIFPYFPKKLYSIIVELREFFVCFPTSKSFTWLLPPHFHCWPAVHHPWMLIQTRPSNAIFFSADFINFVFFFELAVYGAFILKFCNSIPGVFSPFPAANFSDRIVYWHVARLIGWGKYDGDNHYWLAVNSFGRHWGDDGEPFSSHWIFWRSYWFSSLTGSEHSNSWIRL